MPALDPKLTPKARDDLKVVMNAWLVTLKNRKTRPHTYGAALSSAWKRIRPNADAPFDEAAAEMAIPKYIDTEDPAHVYRLFVHLWNDICQDERQLADGFNEILAARSLGYKFTYKPGAAGTGELHPVEISPTQEMENLVRARDYASLHDEFHRARRNIEVDPRTAITAACALFEAFCKVHIDDRGLVRPTKQEPAGLWKAVKEDLNLGNDLTTMIGGLGGVVSGLAAYRTHEGSAHGHGLEDLPAPEPRHARLCLHASETIIHFLMETAQLTRPR